eukprot:m.448407 g.448407  ORF g.448407 m.448407 type:complete len:57 (+) comp19655_c0_seq1:1274-1444(+)
MRNSTAKATFSTPGAQRLASVWITARARVWVHRRTAPCRKSESKPLTLDGPPLFTP